MRENLLVNLGKAVPQKMGGRDYLVAPLTLIVPGVLSGSQGPIYYPPEEVERWPGLWNHVPLVVYHPVENGQHVTARDPDILDKSGVGIVLRDRYEGDKRQAEAWFEVEATRRVDQTLPASARILPRLLSGKSIEISTGLDLDKEPASDGAAFNGQAYTSIARNFRPDHLAILPDAKGACSNEDGCGVNVNDSQDERDFLECQEECIDVCLGEIANILNQQAINESFETHLALNCGGEGGTKGPCKEEGSGESDGKKEEKKSKIKPISPKGDSTLKAFGWQTKDGSTYDHPDLPGESVKLSFEKLPGGRQRLIAEHTTSTGTKKISGADQIEYSISQHAQRSGHIEQPGAPNTRRYVGKKQTSNEGEAMKRDEMIQHLTTNCDCWKGKEDKAVLEKMKDEQLAKLVNQSKIILVVNQIKNKKATNAPADEAVAGVPWTELAVLLGVDLNPADDPIAFASALKAKVDEISSKLGGAPVEPDMDDAAVTMAATEDEEQVAMAAGTQEVDKVGNRKKKPLSSADWLKNAPPEVRSAVTNAMNLEKQAKVKLVQRIVGNVSDPTKRQAIGAKMMSKSLEDLQELVSLIPQAPVQNQQDDLPNFAFAGGAGTGEGLGVSNGEQDDSDNVLPVFAVNFDEMASPKLRQQKTA